MEAIESNNYDHNNENQKHDVSIKALKTLEKVMLSQDKYGFQKYGTALKHTQNYNWLQMFLEEMADGLKYIQNEIDRKNDAIEWLEYAVEQGEWGYVHFALKTLKVEGTGKEENPVNL